MNGTTFDSSVLLTGYPTFLARHMLTQLLTQEPATQLFAVVQGKALDEAEEHLRTLPEEARQRVRILEGDAAHMDLGLAGYEFRQLAEQVDRIHHCAEISYLGVDRRAAENGNVKATAEVLEMAAACRRLRCLVHHSTAFVSGDRKGVVLESELDSGQTFHNPLEETKARAEALVRAAMGRIPAAIVRPTHVVGDSRTGAVDRLDGPYLVVSLILSSPAEFPFPLPGRGDAALHLVPVDYVTRAAQAIGCDSRSPGRTFHLVDPLPLSVQQVFERVAHLVGHRSPRGFFPTTLTKALLHTPGLERFASSPRAFLDQLVTAVTYDDRNTTALLAGTNISCPPVASYLDKMVTFVRSRVRDRRSAQMTVP